MPLIRTDHVSCEALPKTKQKEKKLIRQNNSNIKKMIEHMIKITTWGKTNRTYNKKKRYILILFKKLC